MPYVGGGDEGERVSGQGAGREASVRRAGGWTERVLVQGRGEVLNEGKGAGGRWQRSAQGDFFEQGCGKCCGSM